VIPVAIRTTIARLIIFFIGTVFVLAALIPMQQAGVEKSPFVLVFEKVGIPYAADIFNFVILTAILSAANSGLYASGRMLWSLSNEKTLPRCFARVNKNGVPLTALGFYARRRAGAVLKRRGAGHGVCRAVGDFRLCGGGGVDQHLRVALRFPSAICSPASRSALQYRAPWYPLVPVLGFILCVVACVGLGLTRARELRFGAGFRLSPCVMVRTT
jgi:S-methylmethionine transporter